MYGTQTRDADPDAPLPVRRSRTPLSTPSHTDYCITRRDNILCDPQPIGAFSSQPALVRPPRVEAAFAEQPARGDVLAEIVDTK